ncbi:hypothetical protein P1P68_13780 [Streptomyces scabiei]|uniref:hypothetical protein n=1 Tax=Streptomyces scabiei TaxID=1930 RepID=UPI00298FE95B|nr:hypothetical protein [Streptomyces scabiei]MDW8805823.1 hypothetical protein [Streptomyces scabiei]
MRTMNSRLGRRYRVAPHPFNKDGGQGLLYHCTDQDGVERVYKEYKAPVSATSEVHRLHELALLGEEAVRRAERGKGSAVRGGLATTAESSINWPIDVIHGKGGSVAGVVLPLIPRSFMYTDADGRQAARTLDFLYLARAEPPPPEARVRVGVLLRVCDIFRELEDLKLTHGDLSAKNLVWRGQDTHAYLIDCDGLTSWSKPATHGVATQEWTDPRVIADVIPAHDRYSDRFALALVLYRGLFLNPGGPRWPQGPRKGQWIKPSGFPGRLDPTLRQMFGRALDDPFSTSTRPSAADWHHALHRAFLTAGRPPSYRDDALRALEDYASQHRRAVQHQRAAPRPGQSPANALPLQTPRPHPRPQVQRRPQAHVPPPAQPVPRVAPRRQPTPAPARTRRRGSTPWVVTGLLVAAVIGGGVFWFMNNSADPSSALPLRAGPPCPAAVTAHIPDGAGATLLHTYTTESNLIRLCRTVSGKIYYNGTWLDPDARHKKSEQITIPAEPTTDGYRARNHGYLYVIKDGWVVIHMPKGETKKYRLTEAD